MLVNKTSIPERAHYVRNTKREIKNYRFDGSGSGENYRTLGQLLKNILGTAHVLYLSSFLPLQGLDFLKIRVTTL